MFALKLRQFYRITDKVIVRTVRNRRLERPVKALNPGLDHRIKAFESEGLRVQEKELEEFVDQSESDFYQVGEAYNEHMNETLIGKYDMRHRIVKEKYFKENMPNLLTWSEKEQIRHLASTEPNEWTPEKLAESFPVTIPVVKRLLKYPWKPATKERIARHDASVMRNWRELKEGSLSIPEEVRKHFLKFSDRVIPPLKQESIKIELNQEVNIGEFESIVRKCAAKEEQPTSQSTNNNTSLALPVMDADNDGEFKKIKDGKNDAKIVTLEDLATRIKMRLEAGKKVDIRDKVIVESMKSNVDVKNPEQISKEIELYKEDMDKNSLVQFKDKNVAPSEIMNYPERIRIPKKAYKKGATYKVNDCFYDHDGKFLYRVLGMSN